MRNKCSTHKTGMIFFLFKNISLKTSFNKLIKNWNYFSFFSIYQLFFINMLCIFIVNIIVIFHNEH